MDLSVVAGSNLGQLMSAAGNQARRITASSLDSSSQGDGSAAAAPRASGTGRRRRLTLDVTAALLHRARRGARPSAGADFAQTQALAFNDTAESTPSEFSEQSAELSAEERARAFLEGGCGGLSLLNASRLLEQLRSPDTRRTRRGTRRLTAPDADRTLTQLGEDGVAALLQMVDEQLDSFRGSLSDSEDESVADSTVVEAEKTLTSENQEKTRDEAIALSDSHEDAENERPCGDDLQSAETSDKSALISSVISPLDSAGPGRRSALTNLSNTTAADSRCSGVWPDSNRSIVAGSLDQTASWSSRGSSERGRLGSPRASLRLSTAVPLLQSTPRRSKVGSQISLRLEASSTALEASAASKLGTTASSVSSAAPSLPVTEEETHGENKAPEMKTEDSFRLPVEMADPAREAEEVICSRLQSMSLSSTAMERLAVSCELSELERSAGSCGPSEQKRPAVSCSPSEQKQPAVPCESSELAQSATACNPAEQEQLPVSCNTSELERSAAAATGRQRRRPRGSRTRRKDESAVQSQLQSSVSSEAASSAAERRSKSRRRTAEVTAALVQRARTEASASLGHPLHASFDSTTESVSGRASQQSAELSAEERARAFLEGGCGGLSLLNASRLLEQLRSPDTRRTRRGTRRLTAPDADRTLTQLGEDGVAALLQMVDEQLDSFRGSLSDSEDEQTVNEDTVVEADETLVADQQETPSDQDVDPRSANSTTENAAAAKGSEPSHEGSGKSGACSSAVNITVTVPEPGDTAGAWLDDSRSILAGSLDQTGRSGRGSPRASLRLSTAVPLLQSTPRRSKVGSQISLRLELSSTATEASSVSRATRASTASRASTVSAEASNTSRATRASAAPRASSAATEASNVSIATRASMASTASTASSEVSSMSRATRASAASRHFTATTETEGFIAPTVPEMFTSPADIEATSVPTPAEGFAAPSAAETSTARSASEASKTAAAAEIAAVMEDSESMGAPRPSLQREDDTGDESDTTLEEEAMEDGDTTLEEEAMEDNGGEAVEEDVIEDNSRADVIEDNSRADVIEDNSRADLGEEPVENNMDTMVKEVVMEDSGSEAVEEELIEDKRDTALEGEVMEDNTTIPQTSSPSSCARPIQESTLSQPVGSPPTSQPRVLASASVLSEATNTAEATPPSATPIASLSSSTVTGVSSFRAPQLRSPATANSSLTGVSEISIRRPAGRDSTLAAAAACELSLLAGPDASGRRRTTRGSRSRLAPPGASFVDDTLHEHEEEDWQDAEDEGAGDAEEAAERMDQHDGGASPGQVSDVTSTSDILEGTRTAEMKALMPNSLHHISVAGCRPRVSASPVVTSPESAPARAASQVADASLSVLADSALSAPAGPAARQSGGQGRRADRSSATAGSRLDASAAAAGAVGGSPAPSVSPLFNSTMKGEDRPRMAAARGGAGSLSSSFGGPNRLLALADSPAESPEQVNTSHRSAASKLSRSRRNTSRRSGSFTKKATGRGSRSHLGTSVTGTRDRSGLSLLLDDTMDRTPTAPAPSRSRLGSPPTDPSRSSRDETGDSRGANRASAGSLSYSDPALNDDKNHSSRSSRSSGVSAGGRNKPRRADVIIPHRGSGDGRRFTPTSPGASGDLDSTLVGDDGLLSQTPACGPVRPDAAGDRPGPLDETPAEQPSFGYMTRPSAGDPARLSVASGAPLAASALFDEFSGNLDEFSDESEYSDEDESMPAAEEELPRPPRTAAGRRPTAQERFAELFPGGAAAAAPPAARAPRTKKAARYTAVRSHVRLFQESDAAHKRWFKANATGLKVSSEAQCEFVRALEQYEQLVLAQLTEVLAGRERVTTGDVLELLRRSGVARSPEEVRCLVRQYLSRDAQMELLRVTEAGGGMYPVLDPLTEL